MNAARRASKRIGLFFSELPDKFRARKTEAAHLVGWPKKKMVVVSSVEKKIVKGTPVFFANFVPPRRGSQFAPFADHNIVLALEAAAHQVAIASMKKFEGVKRANMLVVMNSFKWKWPSHPSANVLVEVAPKREINLRGVNYRVFACTFTDVGNLANVFAKGELTISIIPKGKAFN